MSTASNKNIIMNRVEMKELEQILLIVYRLFIPNFNLHNQVCINYTVDVIQLPSKIGLQVLKVSFD